MGRIETHAEVVAACGCAALAKELTRVTASDVSPKRVQGWRIRNSIPGSFFAPVAEAAAAIGFPEVTVGRLAAMADVRLDVAPAQDTAA